MTGTNIVKALIEYIKAYHPLKEADVTKLMLEYIESLQTKERPLKKVHDLLFSIQKKIKS